MSAFIDAHRERFGVEPICRVLRAHGVQIAPTTYYAAKTRPRSARSKRDEVVLAHVVRVHESPMIGRRLYGARKVYEELARKEARGEHPELGHVQCCQVERLMRTNGLRGVRRDRPFVTTRSSSGASVCDGAPIVGAAKVTISGSSSRESVPSARGVSHASGLYARPVTSRSVTSAGRPLVVLMVMPGLGAGGGAERSLEAMAPLLGGLGVEAHVAVLTNRQALVPKLEGWGVRVHDLSSAPSTTSRVRKIRRLLRTLRPDVVHATLFDATLPTQLASLGTGVPILVTWATTDFVAERRLEADGNTRKLTAYRLLEMLLGRMSRSWFHAVSEGVARSNREAMRVTSDRVLVGERGRAPEQFPFRGLPSTLNKCVPRTVLAIGRQEPVKGYGELLEQFDRLAACGDGVQLVIAGREGSDTARLRQIHSSMEHPASVRFLGQRSDVLELMSTASLLVCSSWREGAAGAVIEAMGVGVPVVTVPLAGLHGVTIDGVNSVVCPRASLSEGMLRVLEDVDLADRIVLGARATFDERFTADRSARRMVEIYRSVSGQLS